MPGWCSPSSILLFREPVEHNTKKKAEHQSRAGSGGHMFGMLDYRAHKLMWLLWLPIRLLIRIVFFVNIAASVLIAQSTNYPILVRIVIAYVAFEGIGMLLLAFWWAVNW